MTENETFPASSTNSLFWLESRSTEHSTLYLVPVVTREVRFGCLCDWHEYHCFGLGWAQCVAVCCGRVYDWHVQVWKRQIHMFCINGTETLRLALSALASHSPSLTSYLPLLLFLLLPLQGLVRGTRMYRDPVGP